MKEHGKYTFTEFISIILNQKHMTNYTKSVSGLRHM